MRLIRVGILILLALLLLPRTVHAQDTTGIYYYAIDQEETITEQFYSVVCSPKASPEEVSRVLFSALFSSLQGKEMTYVPEGTRLLSTQVVDNQLVLNLSQEVLQSGGTYREQLFVQQVTKTAYSIPEIQGIILYVEGQEASLPEGTVFPTREAM